MGTSAPTYSANTTANAAMAPVATTRKYAHPYRNPTSSP